MTTRFLRYASLGLTVALAGAAHAEAPQMSSNKDGSADSSPGESVARVSPGRHVPRGNRDAQAANSVDSSLSAKSRYDGLVENVAQHYQLDSALLHAVISVESRYDPKAHSPSGAVGLMQLMPATARRYGAIDLFDPEQNLRAGARYLRDLLGMFGSDIQLALAAYHAGEGAVAKHRNSIPPFQATIEYVSKVLEHYHRYRSDGPR